MTKHTWGGKQAPRSSICSAEPEKAGRGWEWEKLIEDSLIKVKRDLRLVFLRTKQMKKTTWHSLKCHNTNQKKALFVTELEASIRGDKWENRPGVDGQGPAEQCGLCTNCTRFQTILTWRDPETGLSPFHIKVILPVSSSLHMIYSFVMLIPASLQPDSSRSFP